MGMLQYRTKLLPLERAARFAKCLLANNRCTGVEIQTSKRATSDSRYYVTWLPANPARVEAMLDRQQAARIQRADTQAFTFCRDTEHDFHHCHSHASGEVYEVTLQSCTCPDFERRCAPHGIVCKHVLALASAVRAGQTTEFEPVPAKVPSDRERRAADARNFERIFGP